MEKNRSSGGPRGFSRGGGASGNRGGFGRGSRGGFGSKPSFGGAPRPRYGDTSRGGSFGGARRSSYGAGSRQSYSDRPAYGRSSRPGYGNRPSRSGGFESRPPYGNRSQYNNPETGSFKPQTVYGTGYKGTPPQAPNERPARVDGAFGRRMSGPRAPRYSERDSAQSFSYRNQSTGDRPRRRAPSDPQAGNRTRGFIKESSSEQTPAAPTFPMRINRYLALQKKASRRDADRLIEAGRVMLNDKKAKLGDKVNEGDAITILSADDARTDRQSR